jgi:hypothetical protein
MNQDINPLDLIARDLSQSTNPVILLAQNPSLDAVYSAFSLYLGLSKMGKSPTIVASTKVTYNIKDIDLIRTSLTSSGDNLVISFPYTDGSIDKVDYKIENNTFNLIVIPRPGFPKVSPEQVSFSYAGGKADCLIALDAPSVESIGRIYTENQEAFDQLPLINIDRHSNNMQYGSVNYVIPAVASVSQLVLDIMRGVQIAIDEVMATQILNGIVGATNNFTLPTANAEVFADVAELMKLGAVREQSIESQAPAPRSPGRAQQGQPVSAPQSNQGRSMQQKPQDQGKPSPQQPQVQPQGQGQARPQNQGRPQSQPQNQGRSQTQSQNQTQRNSQPRQNVAQQPNQKPQTNPNDLPKAQEEQPAQNKSWIEAIPQDKSPAQDVTQKSNSDADETPQDWLKPKIFKGNGFV